MWTKNSYNAIFDWIDTTKRSHVKQTLLADGLTDIVQRLELANNLGDWYKITREAAEAVGDRVVESIALQAQRELAPHSFIG